MIRFDVETRRGTFSLRTAWESDARVAGLYGPTGSGKTTLLHILAGLTRPVRGRIELDGRVLFDHEQGLDVPPEHRQLGVVFQDDRLFPHLTVSRNLRFARRAGKGEGPGFDEVVHLLDLEGLLERGVRGLSGGERRLVAVGRALLAGPRLLLLDEPLTGLDPARRRRVLAYLLRLKERLDLRMLLVSHGFSDFLALVDAMALLEDGTITAAGPPRRLLDRAMALGDPEPLETAVEGLVTAVHGDSVRVESAGARFELVLPGARVGQVALVSVEAREVLVGVGAPPRTSARNVLSGRVAEVRPAGRSVFLAVEAGPTVWAEVTPESVRELGLEPGAPVFLLMKASALRGAVLAPPSRSGRGLGSPGVVR